MAGWSDRAGRRDGRGQCARRPGAFALALAVVALVGTAVTITAQVNAAPISAQTGNDAVDRQLAGRLFLRQEVSNPEPYVGEPVVVTYTLYSDGISLGNAQSNAPDLKGAIVEPLFQSASPDFQSVTYDGRTMKAAQVYRMAVIPTSPGELVSAGYSITGALPISSQRRSRNPFNDPFFDDMFDNPFFGGRVMKVEIPCSPLRLNVKPLPAEGQPAGFNGTVGDFTLEARADRAEATQDDILGLTLTVKGRGAVELLNPPSFPSSGDFEMVEQTNKVEKGSDGVSGSKTFELALRPMRAGRLAIPPIQYPIFDPYAGRYKTLQTQPIEVAVKPGRGGTGGVAIAGKPAGPSGEPTVKDLQWLHGIGKLEMRRPELLFTDPAFWGVQVLLAAGLLVSWRRDLRRRTIDPAERRRAGAGRAFNKRLRAIRRGAASGTPIEQSAGAIEQAARGLIADRFDLAADGLTRHQIEQLLQSRAMPEERIRRLCDLLDECASLRYAPTGAIDGRNLNRWIDEIVGIVREGLRE